VTLDFGHCGGELEARASPSLFVSLLDPGEHDRAVQCLKSWFDWA
jgi:hypothetical protein